MLGTTPALVRVTEFEKVGWFRHEAVPRDVGYLDLTVDGVPLRRVLAWPGGDEAHEVTPIRNEWAAPTHEADYLRALLGRPVGCDHSVMPDGRVPLLVCGIDFDLDCRALTARVVQGEDEVEWREIAWQAASDPLDLDEQEMPVISLSFRREDYDAVLLPLLEVALRP